MDSELFEDFPKEKPKESLIDGIADALEKNIGTPRESGHNVIFASIAIHALKELPDLATPSIIDGIRKLVRLFDNSHPGSGYYGKAMGRITGNKVILPEIDDGVPPYENVKGMIEAVLDEIVNQDSKIHRPGLWWPRTLKQPRCRYHRPRAVWLFRTYTSSDRVTLPAPASMARLTKRSR